MQVEHRLAKRHAHLLDLVELGRVLLDQIEQRGVHGLRRRRRRPQPQRDLLELPALAEIGDRELRLSAVGIGVVEAAVLGGEEFLGREEFLLGEQRRHQARQRAAALMEFHRRRAPGGEGAGGLAAGEAERLRHGVAVEAAQAADRRRGAERAERARPMPALGAEHRIVGADADPRHHLHAGDQRDQEIAAGRAVALGDGERRRHHLGRDMRQRRAVGVAHGDGGDQEAVEHGRAGERQPVAADHARLVRLRERAGERRDLLGLVAVAAGHRAGQRVEQQILAALAHVLGQVFVLQRGREIRQNLCRPRFAISVSRAMLECVPCGTFGWTPYRHLRRH